MNFAPELGAWLWWSFGLPLSVVGVTLAVVFVRPWHLWALLGVLVMACTWRSVPLTHKFLLTHDEMDVT